MKKILFVVLLAGLYNFSNAQIEFGLKAGLSSFDVASSSKVFTSQNSIYKLNFKDAKYGHHFGVYGQAKLLGIFIQPSVLFNSNHVSYSLEEYSERGIFDKILNEKYYNIDLPLMAGLKVSFIRLYAGPVAHLRLTTSSDLFNIKGYNEHFDKATYGYQAGVGINISKLRFDIAYEGNFSKFGDHIYIGDNKVNFENGPARVLTTISYKF
jgi:hypothetical protein